MGKALTAAVVHQITAYDASYLALAQRLDMRVLTADAKLARAVAETGRAILLESSRID